MTHPLDRPLWSALTSAQAHLRSGDDRAWRFPADVSPFAAARDDSADALAALAALIPTGDDISLVERTPPSPPPGVRLLKSANVLQMIGARFVGERAHDLALTPLGDDEAPEMLALATLTKPGPFRARTHTLGRFLGLRLDGRLVAMAGERLRTDDFIEISAVCTHPDARGRGYGAALLCAVGARIVHDGKIPFLHTYADNAGAIALYRKLGFEARCEVVQAVWG